VVAVAAGVAWVQHPDYVDGPPQSPAIHRRISSTSQGRRQRQQRTAGSCRGPRRGSSTGKLHWVDRHGVLLLVLMFSMSMLAGDHPVVGGP
jgi:hypothetical protein